MTTSVLDLRLVLPEDVLFVPVEDLAESVRSALGAREGDVAVTRPGFRTPSRLVDALTVALLKSFRPASRIVDAVLRFSTAHGLDPEETLDEAFPALQLFCASHVLVPDDSPWVAGIPVAWAPGQVVAGFEILGVVQRTHDTVVYRARDREGGDVALKFEQPDAPARTTDMLRREEALLARLRASAPRLVASGTYGGLRYLAVEWIDGVPLAARAAEIRTRAAPGWRERLHALACEMADRYAQVHAAGILHGDVHSANVLVDPGDRVILIDFGMGRAPGAEPPLDHPLRTGLGWYLDPEAARRALDGELPPPIDAAAEQYAVAALVYETITGGRYLDFELEITPIYKAITLDPPLPFTRRGFEAWPAVEDVLHRALHKRSEERFDSTSAFASALRAARPPADAQVRSRYNADARAFVDTFLPASPGDLPPLRTAFPSPPRVACDRGAAGLAWFLYRVALSRERPDLLATADIWCRRAAREVDEVGAFHTPVVAVDGFRIDLCSVLHRAPGLHYVHALVCFARGDGMGLAGAVDRFVDASVASAGVHDVTLGRAGTLLAGATLWRATRHALHLDSAERLRALCTTVYLELGALLDDRSAPRLQPLQPLSFAHGWTGLVYAVMRGAEALEVPLPHGLETRARWLAEAARMQAEDPVWISGWCNGTAGHLPLFLLAHRTFGGDAWAEAAERAAWRTASHPDRHAHLCCGLAGRVLALLHMYRATGHTAWVDRARVLGRHLPDSHLPEEARDQPLSLFWGRLGAALALEEMSVPERASMPLFGEQGWPS